MGGSLADYMRSLRRLEALELLGPLSGARPGDHDPGAKIAEYIEHREPRERRLVAALRERGERSRAALLAEVWDDVPEPLHPAAAVAMQAHLEKLEDEGRLSSAASATDPPGKRPWYEGRMRIDLPRVLRGGAIGAGVGAALFGATAGGLWWQLFRRPLPKTSGRLSVQGLEGTVEIARDRWGMPTVRSPDRGRPLVRPGLLPRPGPALAVRGAAADLLRDRRRAGGQVALPVDKLMRTLGLRRVALREESQLEPGLRSLLEAYCAGLNEAARASSARPPELQLLRLDFEPWRPADMLAGGKLLSFGLSTNWERELLRADLVRELGEERAVRIDPTYPKGNPVVLHPGQGFDGDGLELAEQIGRVRDQIGLAASASGSNNWAVSPKLSATGGALLAGDPHLPSGMPGVWHEIALELDGRFCRGASIPGLPGISLGQNNDVAWSFTNVMADVEDLFVERIEGESYEFLGDWLPLEIVEEPIRVRGSAQPVPHQVRLTHHGPIVNDALGADEAQPLALRWAGLDHVAISTSHVEVLEPSSGPELVEMLGAVTTPVSNLVWADRHGSIGYKMVGRIPIRKGACPDLPKPGWTGEFEWDGWVPYEEMPELVDPDEGFVVSANNRVVDGSYPHHITSDWLDGYRAARIEQLLGGTDEHDLDSFRRMQTDLFSIPGDEVVHRLARLEPTGQRRDPGDRAAEELGPLPHARDRRGHDLPGVPAAAGAGVHARGDRRPGPLRALPGPRRQRLPRPRDLPLALVLASALALGGGGRGADRRILGRAGPGGAARRARRPGGQVRAGSPEHWRWGEVHQLHFPHALGGGHPVADRIFNRTLHPGGGEETVAQIAYNPVDPYEAIWAPSWRMVADPADPDRSRWQAFTGQSGYPWSRHYDDLQPRWSAGEMQPMAGEGPWETLALEPEAAS